ncbi:MAG: hypothetical protein MZV70_15265 [Desulfobacterales bacterium]|nr:hypothetical protein [Desulfobacterales bacterium]
MITMMKGGARGFLLREHFDADIIKCIHVVARGEIWLSAGLVGRVFDELLRECQKKQQLKSPTSHQLAIMKDISRREMEILSYISESMTNDEIAAKTFPERQDGQDAYPQYLRKNRHPQPRRSRPALHPLQAACSKLRKEH